MPLQHLQDQELLNCLNRYPNLKEHLWHLLSIAQAAGDDIVQADEAEHQTIKAIRQMGHEILSSWAISRIEHCVANLPREEHIVGSGKKNSTGTVHSVTFKSPNLCIDNEDEAFDPLVKVHG